MALKLVTGMDHLHVCLSADKASCLNEVPTALSECDSTAIGGASPHEQEQPDGTLQVARHTGATLEVNPKITCGCTCYTYGAGDTLT